MSYYPINENTSIDDIEHLIVNEAGVDYESVSCNTKQLIQQVKSDLSTVKEEIEKEIKERNSLPKDAHRADQRTRYGQN